MVAFVSTTEIIFSERSMENEKDYYCRIKQRGYLKRAYSKN
jgi:hypothetical protein